jgi:hypothetical protein
MAPSTSPASWENTSARPALLEHSKQRIVGHTEPFAEIAMFQIVLVCDRCNAEIARQVRSRNPKSVGRDLSASRRGKSVHEIRERTGKMSMYRRKWEVS